MDRSAGDQSVWSEFAKRYNASDFFQMISNIQNKTKTDRMRQDKNKLKIKHKQNTSIMRTQIKCFAVKYKPAFQALLELIFRGLRISLRTPPPTRVIT